MNVTVFVVPIGVVTLMVLAEAFADEAMVKVAVTVVEFTGVRLLTVTPVPETVIALATVRFVPVSVTATLVP